MSPKAPRSSGGRGQGRPQRSGRPPQGGGGGKAQGGPKAAPGARRGSAKRMTDYVKPAPQPPRRGPGLHDVTGGQCGIGRADELLDVGADDGPREQRDLLLVQHHGLRRQRR